MARNMKQIKVNREAEIANVKLPRRSPGKPSGLYLVELRAQAPRSDLPKRRLVVTIDAGGDTGERPKSIKITHL
jgi:hypothetical protein